MDLEMDNMRVVIVMIVLCVSLTGLATVMSCPDTWIAFQSSCYLFGHNEKMTFYEAETFCLHHGGHLVHVNSAYENAFLKDELRRHYHENVWMGLTDERIEGYWAFTDTHSLATFTNWNPNEPNGHTKENCAEFREVARYLWNDVPCSKLNEPICEQGNGLTIVG